jgi:UPF0716 protein FxsA
MAGWLFIAFVTVPFAELWLLLHLGSVVGAGPTFGLVILTGAVGAWLARREGYRTLLAIQNEMAKGALPAGELVDGMIIFMGGALLLTPGILTDALGFAMIIPFTRFLIRRSLVAWMQRKVEAGAVHVHVNQNPAHTMHTEFDPRTGQPRRDEDPRVIDATFDE